MALSLIAGATVFSSCTNDDIEICTATTFNINIDGVISPFVEYEDGELTAIDSNYKIRTRLFLYDQKGDLAVEEVQYLKNYSAKAKVETFVAPGKYTAIVMTDVVEITSTKVSFQYWLFNDSTKLSKATIQDPGFIGGRYKIMGLDSKQITITGKDGDISFSPQPVGALILCHILNWNAYSDYKTYGWETNRTCDYCTFEQSGKYSPSIEAANDYSWYLSKSSVDKSYNGIYGYYFVFPMKNASFRFYGQDKNNKQYYFGDSEITIPDIKAGDEFYFVATLKDPDNRNNDTFEYYNLSTTRAAADIFKKGENTNKAVNLMDQKSVRLEELTSAVMK